MILNDTAISFFFLPKNSVGSYCITELLSFPEAAENCKFIEKCLQRSSIFIDVVDLEGNASNFTQNFSLHVFFTYIFKSFVLSLRSHESLHRLLLFFYGRI